jgi:hypothetical protein
MTDWIDDPSIDQSFYPSALPPSHLPSSRTSVLQPHVSTPGDNIILDFDSCRARLFLPPRIYSLQRRAGTNRTTFERAAYRRDSKEGV